MRERWQEAKASALRKDVQDAIHRLRRAGDEVKTRLANCATIERQSLEAHFGRLEDLSTEAKARIAKSLRSQSRETFSQDLGRAYCLFLLSAYLDAHTLPGSDAIFIKAICISYLEPDPAIDPMKTIESGNLDEFRQFIGANPHSLNTLREPYQWTLLHYLAGLGRGTLPVHSTMALDLIAAGADVNCRTELGWTPLILIAMGGEKAAVSITKLLIEHGADVGAVDNHGCDWRIHWQHGNEIRAILDAAMTPAQKEANRLHLERLFSPKG